MLDKNKEQNKLGKNKEQNKQNPPINARYVHHTVIYHFKSQNILGVLTSRKKLDM